MAELHVSKKTISKLLSDMQGRKYVIPDFQRPYKWDVEKCETLWNDITNFLITDAESGADYFLGTIVSYLNENKNLEIIDGQQRITSFFLLLRAFYKKLDDMHETDDVRGLKTQVAPCIWDINPKSLKVADMAVIHIESLVATDEDNDVLHSILRTGSCDDNAKDNYSLNYRFFKKECDEFAEHYPLQWMNLCVTVLHKCIILPIECDTPETALTIFSTLNDRGMPLADSDIFKAQIYRNKEGKDARKEFTNTWKELTEVCKNANLSIDDIFRYYSHVLRASNGDKGKEVGLRKFYADGNYSKLKHGELMSEIMLLSNFWLDVNKRRSAEEYDLSFDAKKYLHCLEYYPNEFWKYPTSVFFITNRGSESFERDFTSFLRKMVAFLFVKFIDAPTVNAIKDDIYNACISVYQKNEPFNKELNTQSVMEKIADHADSRLSRALLLLDAYLNEEQKDLIVPTFDIEHIFPQRWQQANYNGWNEEDAKAYLNKFGNKIIFEKKLNIQAGNGYFGRKKEKYLKSDIAEVKELGRSTKDDWTKVDIESRETAFVSQLINFFEVSLKA